MRVRPIVISLGFLILAQIGASTPADTPTTIKFDRDILPILADNCFACHGPDQKARKAKLRLDTKQGAFRVRNDIHVIVPGKSVASELYKRIISTEETEVMPPPKSKKKLTAQQIDLVKRWIDGGAKWAKHWSFEKPNRADLPTIKNKTWPKNAIDTFVLARLEKEGLQPSHE